MASSADCTDFLRQFSEEYPENETHCVNKYFFYISKEHLRLCMQHAGANRSVIIYFLSVLMEISFPQTSLYLLSALIEIS